MVDISKFESLRRFDQEVLLEVVREAEARLQAQLAIATAADQRALTFVGFQIASVTGALAGGIALVSKQKPDLLMALLALCFAAFLLYAAFIAVKTVRPSEFHIPGNRSMGWLPENWMGAEGKDFSLKQARLEQAACLDDAIQDNDKALSRAALSMRRSMDLTLWTVAIGGLLLLLLIVSRNISIREPTSEIMILAHVIK